MEFSHEKITGADGRYKWKTPFLEGKIHLATFKPKKCTVKYKGYNCGENKYAKSNGKQWVSMSGLQLLNDDKKIRMPSWSGYIVKDPECKEVTICNNETEYEKTAPTMSSDRVCAPLTECKKPTDSWEGEYEETEPTKSGSMNTSDRICKPVQTCKLFKYGDLPKIGDKGWYKSDRTCNNTIEMCGLEKYQNKTPYTPSSDGAFVQKRECYDLTSCTKISTRQTIRFHEMLTTKNGRQSL